mgnify:CR=1 FL=1
MIVKEKNGEGFLDLRICDNLELMAEIKDNTIDLIYCDFMELVESLKTTKI